jgi:hypothetical protein
VDCGPALACCSPAWASARAPRRRVVLPEQALIPLTGQLVCPALRHLRQPGDAAALTSRNAFAIFLGFSLLPDVRRPSDGPEVDLARCSLGRCELGGDLLAARVLPASPSGWKPSRRAVRKSPLSRPHLRSGAGSGRSPGCELPLWHTSVPDPRLAKGCGP